MSTSVTVTCVCGAWIGSHACEVVAGPADPVYNLSEIELALETALGGQLPLAVWQDVLKILLGRRL